MSRIETEAQARELLDNVAKQNPARWPAAMQTVAVDAIAAVEGLMKHVGEVEAKYDKVIRALVGELRAIRGGGKPNGASRAQAPAAVAPGETVNEAQEAPPAAASAVPEPAAAPAGDAQRAAEAMMDEAIAAEEAEKNGGRGRPQATK